MKETKETLKIAYCDFWPGWDKENFIQPILEKYYNVVIDQNNPDVLFHSIFNGQRDARRYTCKKVLFLGENYRPRQFKTDYSISFDPISNTNFRLPLWQAFILMKPEIINDLAKRSRHGGFDNFGAFVVSNQSNQLRNSHFDQLHQYKRVKSYGKVRTNDLKLQQYSNGKYWRTAKDQFFFNNSHKFFMAYENTSYPYYCTEKLMDAFTSNSVPIYWGDPKVKEDWNENAFINIADHGNDWLDVIKKIDNDHIWFDEIYSQPVFTDTQFNKMQNNLIEFENWLLNVITK